MENCSTLLITQTQWNVIVLKAPLNFPLYSKGKSSNLEDIQIETSSKQLVEFSLPQQKNYARPYIGRARRKNFENYCRPLYRSKSSYLSEKLGTRKLWVSALKKEMDFGSILRFAAIILSQGVATISLLQCLSKASTDMFRICVQTLERYFSSGLCSFPFFTNKLKIGLVLVP